MNLGVQTTPLPTCLELSPEEIVITLTDLSHRYYFTFLQKKKTEQKLYQPFEGNCVPGASGHSELRLCMDSTQPIGRDGGRREAGPPKPSQGRRDPGTLRSLGDSDCGDKGQLEDPRRNSMFSSKCSHNFPSLSWIVLKVAALPSRSRPF